MGDLKPNVLVLTTAHPPLDIRIFRKQATSLAADGFGVTMAAPDWGDPQATIEAASIHFVPLSGGTRRRDRIFRLSSVARLLWTRGRGFDAWHVHDPELLVLAAPMRILFARRVHLVYDVHENYAAAMLSRAWIPRLLRRLVSILVRRVERVLALAASIVVTATPTIATQFTESSRRRVLINNNFPLFPKHSDDATTRHVAVPAPTDGIVRCVFIGGLTLVRGIREMIEAMRLLGDNPVELVLAGWYESEALERELLRDAPASVVSCGVLPFEAVPSLLASAHIGLLCFLPEPNHVDSMPTKLFEYMDAGLAVIASDFDSWSQFVTTPEVGVQVDPTAPHDIANAISALAADPELRQKMGARGRDLVRASYSWDAEATVLCATYCEVVMGTSA